MTGPPPPPFPAPPPPPPAPTVPRPRGSVGAGVAIAFVCWAVSVVPFGVAFLSLLCDVDGTCTDADTNRRRAGLVIAALLWLVSGPAALLVGGRKLFLVASAVPLVLAAPLLPYFLAGP